MATQEKTCFDCLNCKVSAKSMKGKRLCFCSETKKKERHKEEYWLTRKKCKKFDDMDGKCKPIKSIPGERILLRGSQFFRSSFPHGDGMSKGMKTLKREAGIEA